jgi:hypothetical protein
MASPNRFLAFLIAAALLLGHPPAGPGQTAAPPPLPGGQPASPTPPPFAAVPPPSSGAAGFEPACPALFDPARPPSPWYADAEMAVLFNAAVHFNGHVGAVEDDNSVFVSPRVFLGRRFEGGGSVRFTYRNLTEVGHLGSQGSPSGDWSSESHFTTNWFDLDYVSREYAPLDWWRFQWEAGGRLVYRSEGWSDESPYARYEFTHTYFGGGPHFGLTSNALLGDSGWALFGRAETAVTFGGGDSVSRYQPLLTFGGPFVVDVPSSHGTRTSELQFDLGLQLGLMKRWQLPRASVGLGFGVQADVLSMGNLGGPGFDTFGLVNVGPFLRCEIGF